MKTFGKYKLTWFVLAVCIIELFSACDADRCKRCRGSDGVSPIPVAALERIEVNFEGEIRLFQDTFQFVAVAGKSAAISNISTIVENGTWRIEYERCITCEKDVIITLVVKDLKSIEYFSAGKLSAEETTQFSELEILNHANAVINFEDLQSQNLKLQNKGNGDIVMKGIGNTLEAIMDGSGVIRTFEMPSNSVTAINNSSGTIFTTAIQSFNVAINGNGNIHYRGIAPSNVDIKGTGQLIDAN